MFKNEIFFSEKQLQQISKDSFEDAFWSIVGNRVGPLVESNAGSDVGDGVGSVVRVFVEPKELFTQK